MRPSAAIALVLALLPAVPARPDDAPTPSRLRVEGNRLTFEGRPVLLRGVAVGDPVLGRSDRPTADYEVLARDWKANVVRMGIHPGLWKARDKDGLLDALGRDARAAIDAEMFVIIDWHVIGWPDGGHEIPRWKGAQPDQYDSSLPLARDFWTRVADRFGREDRILFELWNEPAYFNKENKPDGANDPGWKGLKPSMRELTDLIRERSDNVVITTGTRWAYDLRGIRQDPLPGSNIAYAWHVYAGHDKNDPAKWNEKLDGLDEVAPVIVTEWGFQRGSTQHYGGGPDEFGIPFLRDFLDARRLGWTAWVWHPHWGPPMLESDWRTPNEFGRFVQSALSRPPG